MPLPNQAYHAYSPRPFKREERGEVEILFGGLHWRLEKVIQAALENVGYRARPLRTATKDDLRQAAEFKPLSRQMIEREAALKR